MVFLGNLNSFSLKVCLIRETCSFTHSEIVSRKYNILILSDKCEMNFSNNELARVSFDEFSIFFLILLQKGVT